VGIVNAESERGQNHDLADGLTLYLMGTDGGLVKTPGAMWVTAFGSLGATRTHHPTRAGARRARSSACAAPSTT
jgi:hypothetical protein